MLKLCRTGTRAVLTVFMALAMVLVGAYVPGIVMAAGSAPDLLTADSFAVLGWSTVTNTGNTVLTGDLGLYSGTSITGFYGTSENDGPGTVLGAIHQTDAVAQQAQVDATAAYNNLQGQTYDTDMTAISDMAGMTLVPGVYNFDSTASVGGGGTLTLDAQNDPNAVFIFQVGSALDFSVGSSVVVINAPPDFCNKFWAVGSDATLNTGCVVQGTIIASGAITVNNGASLYGRAISLNAAVTLDDNGIMVPCQTDAPSSPPFTLEIFKFNDLNGNGIYEPLTEFPLAGWDFDITGPSAYSNSGTTNEDGFIVITGLDEGDYEVTESPVQTGWDVTTANPQTVAVSASGGERAVFGNQLAEGTLAIFKFNDVNGDGIYSPIDGDAPLSGWDYDVTGPSAYSDSGTTGADGFLLFTGLALGDYEVTETVQLGWGVTTGNPQTATLSAGSGTVVRFGNLQLEPGTLEIFKFNDLNGNGVYEPLDGETPLANWDFDIAGTATTGYSNSGSTDVNGLITLTGLDPDDYLVTETVKSGWEVTTLNPQTATLAVGAEGGARLNFGNQYTYRPPNLPQAVGGEASPVNKVAVVMPWLIVLAVGAGVAVVARRRLSSNR